MKYLFYSVMIISIFYLTPFLYSIAQVLFFEQMAGMVSYAAYTN